MDEKHRTLWISIRQALLIVLGAIEEHLGMERSKPPKHERR
jgi:hypothetical protein